MKSTLLLCLIMVVAVLAGPIKVTSKQDGGDYTASNKLKKVQELRTNTSPKTPQLAPFPFNFKPKPSNKGIVPLKTILESARSSPVIMDVVTQNLLKFGFTKKQILELIASGRVVYEGRVVSLDELSQICCPMGI